MSLRLDRRLRARGTRFLLFPQPGFLPPYHVPEVVRVSPPPGSIAPGPAGGRLYVIDPLDKRHPYGWNVAPDGSRYLYLPPYHGAVRPPLPPGPGGHFDYLRPGTRAFEEAHLYGCVRRVLDIWEDYFGGIVEWSFRRDYRRLELVLLSGWDNAQSGYGFIEVGYGTTATGASLPYSLNFDVLAHELGHTIIYSKVGVPGPETQTGEYFGFHESCGDLVALVSALHFDSVVDHVLAVSRGNIYALNELNRIGELSRSTQIRVACNLVKLSDFAAGWHDEHQLAQPLTGAIFDILVDVYQRLLFERGVIDRRLFESAYTVSSASPAEPVLQAEFDAAYRGRAGAFREPLLAARDYLGACLTYAWGRLSPDYLTYAEVASRLLAADRAVTGGRFQQTMYDCFAWRGIGSVRVGPRLAPREEGHRHAPRPVADRPRAGGPAPPRAALCYRQRIELARRERR